MSCFFLQEFPFTHSNRSVKSKGKPSVTEKSGAQDIMSDQAL